MTKHVIESVEDLVAVVRNRRKSLDISRMRLAIDGEFSHDGICRFESGRADIKLTTLLRFSKVLEFKVVIDLKRPRKRKAAAEVEADSLLESEP